MELKKVREKLEKMRYISENRITESYMLVQKLQDKYNLATKVLRKAKEERDLLIKGRDIAIIEVEELRKEVSRSDEHREAPQYFICPISLVNKKVNMERNRRLYRISSQIKTFVFNVSGSDEGSTTSSRWIYI